MYGTLRYTAGIQYVLWYRYSAAEANLVVSHIRSISSSQLYHGFYSAWDLYRARVLLRADYLYPVDIKVLTESKNIFIKMLNNVGTAVPRITQTRCGTYAAKQWMIAYNNNNMRNPIIEDVGRGLCMLLLLYAIIHCLAAYVLHLVCVILGTAIPKLFNILMKILFYWFL